MTLVHVEESNFDRIYAESSSAIKDFLYMLFEIAGDCGPIGDWDRAELGAVDPFKYLDITYECRSGFRSDSEMYFLHSSAALNLLCRLAQVADEDECSGSTWMADFRGRRERPSRETLIRQYHPELFLILDAFEAGRVVSHSLIHKAFTAALYGLGDFPQALCSVNSEVVLRTFDTHYAGETLPHIRSLEVRPDAANH